MRARAYCAHPSIRDNWALRCKSRCLDQVVNLKREPQCLSPQASLVLIYRPTACPPVGVVVWRGGACTCGALLKRLRFKITSSVANNPHVASESDVNIRVAQMKR
ncbi:hypothetical protein TNCV_3750661 [Trichonephila clavipes]|nr:hypothetical protein TNCV_3750661 [Trichonephila clavipes]